VQKISPENSLQLLINRKEAKNILLTFDVNDHEHFYTPRQNPSSLVRI